MEWIRTYHQYEYVYIIIFILFYLIYLTKLFFLNKKVRLSFKSIFAKLILRALYFYLFIISLLGPTFGDIKKEVKSIGKDLYICIDISNSMNVTDVTPSRLEFIKHEFNQILPKLSSDKLSLILFSSDTYLHCPLTQDHKTFEKYFQNITTNTIKESGSDIESLFIYIKNNITNTSIEIPKTIIIFTDGNFDINNIEDYSNHFTNNNIHILFVGVGTNSGGIVKDKNNKIIVNEKQQKIKSIINRENIINLAQKFNSKYIELPKQSISLLPKHISKIEGKLNKSKKTETNDNKYFYFLFLGILFMIIDIISPIKTTDR